MGDIMNKYYRYFIFVIFISLIHINVVDAAGDYRISLSSTSVTQRKTVTLYIKGNNIAGGFTISSSDSTVCSVSSSSAFVDNNTQQIGINTLKAGNCTIKVSPTTVSDYDGNDLSLPSKTLTLTVTDGGNSSNNNSNNSNVKKSSDATLKSLSIENADLSPEFKGDVLEYTASVDSNVEKVKINAVTNDNKAVVSGAGEVSVSEGANNLELIVSAEDGSTKKYVIKLTVEEKNPIKVKINGKDYIVVKRESNLPDVDLFEKSDVEIGKDKVPGYYNDKLNIYLIALKDSNGKIGLYVYDTKKDSYVEYKWITVCGITLYLNDAKNVIDGYQKFSININNFDIDIYKLNKEEKFGLIYGTNIVTGNRGYYLYDKEEETLSRYYNGEVNLYKDKLDKYVQVAIIVGGVLSGIVIILLTISLIRSGKKHKKINY